MQKNKICVLCSLKRELRPVFENYRWTDNLSLCWTKILAVRSVRTWDGLLLEIIPSCLWGAHKQAGWSLRIWQRRQKHRMRDWTRYPFKFNFMNLKTVSTFQVCINGICLQNSFHLSRANLWFAIGKCKINLWHGLRRTIFKRLEWRH